MASDAVWALDLGNSSLKALHLTVVDDSVAVTAFDTIRHSKILGGPGISAAEREELIALSLREFVDRNDVTHDDVVVSVPSQNSFARFVTLPPVEAKKIPEVVKFEAVQQIPFDINEVQWDWQMMSEEDDTEKRVGLFAIKNEIVDAELAYFSHEDLPVSTVQMAPMALYNFLLHDRPDLFKSEKRPVVIVNVGAEITDLVVCTQGGVWQRCIMIGGNTFTKAIADAFKINFEKAEKLKRTAAVSKYARQIFQAMRPVFTDLAGEIQKSLGFYSNANPQAKFAKIVAMGGGTQLRGLLKYLQQSLQIPVERPDMFKRVAMGPGISAAKFHEITSEFGVVYGLALQGVGMGRIESNLLPTSIARAHAWAIKFRIFVAAACLLLMVSLMSLGRSVLDTVGYNNKADVRQTNATLINRAQEAQRALDEEMSKTENLEERVAASFQRFQYREMIPLVYETVLSQMPNEQNNPAQTPLYKAFAAGDAEAIKQIPRHQRKQLFVTGMKVEFVEDVNSAQFDQVNMMGGETGGDGALSLEEMAMYYGEDYVAMMGLEETAGEEKDPGFLVTIEGYSPYKDIGLLLDPPSVGDARDRWGLVTRLLHLDELSDVNSPFELYGKGDTQHFELLIGPVVAGESMPVGVGVYEEPMGRMGGASSEDRTLVDPLTREVINSQPALNEYGRPVLDRLGRPVFRENDYWYVLKLKLIWRDAPVVEEESSSSDMSGAYL
jgi:type IV pilus assembly protein PilM